MAIGWPSIKNSDDPWILQSLCKKLYKKSETTKTFIDANAGAANAAITTKTAKIANIPMIAFLKLHFKILLIFLNSDSIIIELIIHVKIGFYTYVIKIFHVSKLVNIDNIYYVKQLVDYYQNNMGVTGGIPLL